MTALFTQVINLDSSTERLASATRALAAEGIAFTRLSAIDGRDKPAEAFAQYDPAVAVRRFGRVLRGGEIACFLSHLAALAAFHDSGAEFGLVFEDDLTARPGAGAALSALIDRAATGDLGGAWDVANLGEPARKFFTPLTSAVVGSLPGGAVPGRAHYFPMRATALLWTRDGAARFLDETPTVAMPYDHQVRLWATARGTGLGLDRALFPHSGADSDIDAGGRRATTDRGLRYLVLKHFRGARNRARAKAHQTAYRKSQ